MNYDLNPETKQESRPVRTTILFGLFCGLAFIPICMVFEYTTAWPIIFRLTVFSFLTLYALILARWGGKRRLAVIFPLLILFLFFFTQNSTAAFLLLVLGIFSWIRSGICFENAFARSLGTELLLSIGGGSLVAYFNPHSALTWALGIWMFFLVQSLYFMIIPGTEEDDIAEVMDAFEQARMRAEGILKD
jgi:hypothetical protein